MAMTIPELIKVWNTVIHLDNITMEKVLAVRPRAAEDALHPYNEILIANPNCSIVEDGWAPFFRHTVNKLVASMEARDLHDMLLQASYLRCILAELYALVVENAPESYNEYVKGTIEAFKKSLEEQLGEAVADDSDVVPTEPDEETPQLKLLLPDDAVLPDPKTSDEPLDKP